MKKKISKEELKRKSEILTQFIDGAINETIDVPDEAIVFFDYDDFVKAFTRKKIELLRLIGEIEPKSLKELAAAAGRKKQAINRDIRDLEAYGIINLERNGKTVIPHVTKKVVVFPISLGISGKKKITAEAFSETTKPFQNTKKKIKETDVTAMIHKMRNESNA